MRVLQNFSPLNKKLTYKTRTSLLFLYFPNNRYSFNRNISYSIVIGGIKTTLPFFRKIVEDEEFIAGNLDTGFITRFNERKKAESLDEAARDLALIATALAYRGKQNSTVGELNKSEQTISRWAMAGRASANRN